MTLVKVIERFCLATNELCFLAWLIWVTLFYFVLGGFDDEKAVIRTINRNSVVGQRHRVRGGEKACRARDAGDILYHRRGGTGARRDRDAESGDRSAEGDQSCGERLYLRRLLRGRSRHLLRQL